MQTPTLTLTLASLPPFLPPSLLGLKVVDVDGARLVVEVVRKACEVRVSGFRVEDLGLVSRI